MSHSALSHARKSRPRWLLRRFSPVLLGLGALAAIAPLSSIQASISPKALVVQTAEVKQVYGAGFSTIFAIPISKKSVTSVNPAIKDIAAGFVSGYGIGYERLHSTSHGAAPFSVTSTAAIYLQDSYPHRAMQETFANLSTLVRRSQKYATDVKASALSGVGNEAILETERLKSTTASYAVTVMFRRGRYTGTLAVLARTPLQPDSVIRLAKTVDARMQQAG
ncbi:MAG TPA: hypothetical protein VF221_14760 [Chloroflexota bacterium]